MKTRAPVLPHIHMRLAANASYSGVFEENDSANEAFTNKLNCVRAKNRNEAARVFLCDVCCIFLLFFASLS